jgi:hypothetical protein
VSGLDAGEVDRAGDPRSPSQKFRVKMQVREDLHHLIRTDSLATTQTEGSGRRRVRQHRWRHRQARAIVAEGGTIPSREPFLFSDLMQQASDTVTLLNQTVCRLSGEIDTAIKEVTGDSPKMRTPCSRTFART